MIEVAPRKKALIIRTIKQDGEWCGRIDGQKTIFRKVTKPEDGSTRIYFNFVLKRKHQEGFAGTVWEAIDTVGDLIGKGKYGRQ